MALGNQITSDCFPLANQARLGVQKKCIISNLMIYLNTTIAALINSIKVHSGPKFRGSKN